MLVLSRKEQEDILIGDNIRVRVVQIRGNKVRLGIEAPDDVKVYRPELLEKMLEAEPEAEPAPVSG